MLNQWQQLTLNTQLLIIGLLSLLLGLMLAWIYHHLAIKPRQFDSIKELEAQNELIETELNELQGLYDHERDLRHACELSIARLESDLESQKQLHQVRLEALQQAQEKLTETFDSLASSALNRNNSQFLHLATEQFKQHQNQAQNDLGQREAAIQNIVKPVQQALEKTHQQMQQLEESRKQAYGSITQQVQQMAESQVALRDETGRLVTALRRPEVRGQWGELTLRRLVELAGMTQHCDFLEQPTISDDDSKYRPDMVINMPSERQIIIDVKTPLDAYLSAVEANDQALQQRHLQRHVANIKARIKELSSKAYWSKLPKSPEFVVLFIPGEQFLNAALDIDQQLIESAIQQKVILATPNSLVALLKTIAFGWHQEALNEGAEQVRLLATELHNRLVTFTAHIGKVGNSLTSAVANYNKAIGSLERSVLPSARRFSELGIRTQKEIEELKTVDETARNPLSSMGVNQPSED